MAQVTLREYLQEIEDALGSGHVEEASTRCQQVLAQFPESLEVQRLLGEVYLAQGHMEEAQQALDWILTNDPENVIAYCDRALISERTSDFDTALDCYQQAYELSRGNRHIRQQFNMLSAKTGQQGFMFSRAGLARLYMRGGLLPQAAQEWGAVLAVSPDRLDARTGLLETYWREEMYDEAEQVALQALQDIPGCVKALLILAHITAPKNMQQAKEYVQRAEMLDPDLSMAQELFEDMMMSQPGHPFLKLLSKAPVVVNTNQRANGVPAPVAEPMYAQVPVSEGPVVVPEALLNGTTTPNSPFAWANLDTWNNGVGTLTPDSHVQESSTGQPALPTWSHDTFSSNDAWTLPEQAEQEPAPPPLQALDGFQFDPWSVPPPKDIPSLPNHDEESAWNGDMSHLPQLNSDTAWQQDVTSTEGINPSWMSAIQEASASSVAPSWLSMLDEQQTSSQPYEEATKQEVPTSATQEQQQPSAEIAPPSASQSSAETSNADVTANPAWREALQASLNTPDAPTASSDDEEEFSFGPEWLKSLGAAEIGDEVPAQSPVESNSAQSALTASPEPAPIAVPEPEVHPTPAVEVYPANDPYIGSATPQASITESPSNTYDWSQYISPEPQPVEQPEQTLVNTLEGLEDSLRSQGFVPLEPNTLSTIAQSQGQEPTAEEPHLALPQQPAEQVPHKELYQTPYHDESTLSSALAQLGNLATPPTQPPYPSPEPLLPAAREASNISGEEPAWMAHLRSTPAPAQEATYNAWSETQHTAPDPIEAPGKLTFDSTFASQYAEPQQQMYNTPERVEMPTAFEPNYVQPREDVPYAPAARTDAFLDSELETTMKRPAVRLQAMAQQRHPTTPLTNQVASRPNDGRTAGVGRDNTRSFQERLIKGYQHQLVGDYDEAMQEYRIIIKSAPELLGDVVSNVRALLKLAPNYSAGYRVLGDAYMRQGEYLQAMEAYNKALTMAKKAKV